MSIYLILGRPGGGKSYEATVYHVIEALKKGRKVITNLPLNLKVFNAVFGEEFIEEHLEIRDRALGPPPPVKANGINWRAKGKQEIISKPFSTVECYQDEWRHKEDGYGALFVVDECHFVLPRGGTPIEVSNWYSMHRHHGFDILLISQGYKKINADIIDMVELVYFVQKNKMLGDENSYTRKIKDGVKGAIVNADTRKYKSEFFKYYQSHTQSNSAVQEAHAQDIRGFWQGGLVRGAMLIFFLFGLSVIYQLTKSDDSDNVIKSVNASTVDKQIKTIVPVEPNLNDDLNNSVLNSEIADSGELVRSRSSASKVVAPVPVVNSVNHPFKRFDINIKGRFYMNDHEDFLFQASQNGQPIFNMTMKDIYMAGYTVQVLGDCMIKLTFDAVYEDYISCSHPTVGLTAQNTAPPAN